MLSDLRALARFALELERIAPAEFVVVDFVLDLAAVDGLAGAWVVLGFIGVAEGFCGAVLLGGEFIGVVPCAWTRVEAPAVRTKPAIAAVVRNCLIMMKPR